MFIIDDNVTFTSEDFPDWKMGIKNYNQGWLTKTDVLYEHFNVVPGLCGVEGTISFESVGRPGWFFRPRGFKIVLDRWQNNESYKKDACFYPRYEKFFKVRNCFNIEKCKV